MTSARTSVSTVLGGLLMLVACPARSAPAYVPDPSHCIVPVRLVLDPSGTSSYTVSVADPVGAPVASATVVLDFTTVTGVEVCRESDPDRDRRVSATTNAAGVVTFSVRGGGVVGTGMARVYADGVLIGSAIPRSPDLDRNLLVDPQDLTRFGDLPTSSTAGDFDGDGDSDAADSLFIVTRLWSKCLAPLSPFAEVYSTSVGDYASYQLKLTHRGLEIGTITPSLAGIGTARSFEMSLFGPYQRTRDYFDDYAVGDTLAMTDLELKAFFDRLHARPALQDTTANAEQWVSLMVLRGAGSSERCWEYIAPSSALADTVFTLLRQSLTNPTLQELVEEFRIHMTGWCR